MRRPLAWLPIWLTLALAGCGSVSRTAGLPKGGDGGAGNGRDMPAGGDQRDMACLGSPSPCGDPCADPLCNGPSFGPPNRQFPLQGDATPDPNEQDNGVGRDDQGWLGLDGSHGSFNHLWIANSSDNNDAGTVTKLDAHTVREVARYLTVTCFSLDTGSKKQCDGQNGCCANDDWNRYQARKNNQGEPDHQAVQLGANFPSRTSVDFNGDLYISNRAFDGQSSVTRIANDTINCVDRNQNLLIESSTDVDGDGVIEEDCNGDGMPDDADSVRALPCKNGLRQEFWGLDDECIVWTTNTFPPNSIGRPLGLAAAARDSDVSDAWAGSYNLGTFERIDGVTGFTKDDTQLPDDCWAHGSGPYGLTVDASGIGWTPGLGNSKLCYFDTQAPANVGVVRDPDWGPMDGYGVAMDRDQNVWVGQGIERYTPDRSNGFNSLGAGFWTKIIDQNGIGIAADSRSNKAYFVYVCLGESVLQIPASTIKVAKMDQRLEDPGWPTIKMPCYGVGVDYDQNVWGVDKMTTTRAKVDDLGAITQPSVLGAPMGNDVCPAGDSCPNAGAYTYSDFTGFGLRNFTRPQGTYSLLIQGCVDGKGKPEDTQWYAVNWDADVPPNTSLTVRARSGNSSRLADPSWRTAMWTPETGQSPASLQGVLMPNLTPQDQNAMVNDAFIQVEFNFRTQSQNATPKLKSFSVGFKCNKGPG